MLILLQRSLPNNEWRIISRQIPTPPTFYDSTAIISSDGRVMGQTKVPSVWYLLRRRCIDFWFADRSQHTESYRRVRHVQKSVRSIPRGSRQCIMTLCWCWSMLIAIREGQRGRIMLWWTSKKMLQIWNRVRSRSSTFLANYRGDHLALAMTGHTPPGSKNGWKRQYWWTSYASFSINIRPIKVPIGRESKRMTSSTVRFPG